MRRVGPGMGEVGAMRTPLKAYALELAELARFMVFAKFWNGALFSTPHASLTRRVANLSGSAIPPTP